MCALLQVLPEARFPLLGGGDEGSPPTSQKFAHSPHLKKSPHSRLPNQIFISTTKSQFPPVNNNL